MHFQFCRQKLLSVILVHVNRLNLFMYTAQHQDHMQKT